MYGIVPYNISPIQQGIQFGHAVVEYAQKYFKDADYQHWAKHNKTFIILNGGTTNAGDLRSESYYGSMQIYEQEIKVNKIKHAVFFEPDLNDALTAVVFLVDERVFDKRKYPDFDSLLNENGSPVLTDKINKDLYDKWVKVIGGKQNVFLREFLSKLRLA